MEFLTPHAEENNPQKNKPPRLNEAADISRPDMSGEQSDGDQNPLPFLALSPQNGEVVAHADEAAGQVLGRAKEQRLRMALAALGKGTWDWDVGSGRIWWDDACYRLLGWQPKDESRTYQEFERTMHPDDREPVRREIRRAIAENRSFELEFRVFRPDAGLYWLISEGAVVERDDNGRPLRVAGIVYDVTGRRLRETENERTRDELELRVAARAGELWQMNSSLAASNSALEKEIASRQRIEDKLRRHVALLEQAHNAITVRDMRGNILYWNRGAELCYGWSSAEATGQNFYELLRTTFPESQKSCQEALDNAGFWEGELRHMRRNNSIIAVLSTCTLQRDAQGNAETILQIDTDITAQQTTDESRQLLLHHALNTREQERLRLSRELHDRVGQGLMALLMGLKALPDLPDPGLKPPSINSRIQDLQDLALNLVEQIDRLSGELRPAVLDNLGLASALCQYVEEWTKVTGVSAQFHAEPQNMPHRLSPASETALYRLTQEALANVELHAEAREVNVLLQEVEDDLLLIIEDDGRGFDVDSVLNRQNETILPTLDECHDRGALAAAGGTGIAAQNNDGNSHSETGSLRATAATARLGLYGMRERVRHLNGAFAVESAPGLGTTIFVRVPVEKKSDSANVESFHRFSPEELAELSLNDQTVFEHRSLLPGNDGESAYLIQDSDTPHEPPGVATSPQMEVEG